MSHVFKGLFIIPTDSLPNTPITCYKKSDSEELRSNKSKKKLNVNMGLYSYLYCGNLIPNN